MTRDLAAALGSPVLKAEEARFGGDLDPSGWRRAFDSSEPADTIRTVVVTGSYSAIVNDASPDVDAEEVREQVERFREELPGLIESIHTWLKSYGITFGESSTLH
jgi:hypothetical protein